MNRWIVYLGLASLPILTSCHACVFGGWDVDQYCAPTARSLLRIDDLEYSFRVYSDSMVYTESEDSLRIFYSSIPGATVSLHLSRPTAETFQVDTARSWAAVFDDRISDYDTLRLRQASIITEAYQVGTCCTQLGCRQNTPDEFSAQVLGVLDNGIEARVLYFEIDIVTQQEEAKEC